MRRTFSFLFILILSACQSEKGTDIAIASSSTLKEDIDYVEEAAKPAKEDTAFDLVYKDIEGQEIKLSDYKGKWVVVNFWATWCAPCRKEMPDFVKFKNNFSDKVEVLGIDYEDSEKEKILSFIQDFNINYPILVTDVYNPTEFEQENTKGLPTTVVFDPLGNQHDKRVGPVHYEDLLEMTGLQDSVNTSSE